MTPLTIANDFVSTLFAVALAVLSSSHRTAAAEDLASEHDRDPTPVPVDLPEHTRGRLYSYSFSKDGKRVAYVDSTDKSLMVVGLDDGKTFKLPVGAPAAATGLSIQTPVWSWRGDSVAFAAWWANEMPSIKTVSVGGGSALTVFSSPVRELRVEDWSRDGKWFLVWLSEGGKASLALVPSERGDPHVLFTVGLEEANDLGCRLSPDGKLVAYGLLKDGRSQIFVYSLAGRRQVSVKPSVYADSQPRWSHDGRFLIFKSNRGKSFDLWAQPFSNGEQRGGSFVAKKNIGRHSVLDRVLEDGRLLYSTPGLSVVGIFRTQIDPRNGEITGQPSLLATGAARGVISPNGREIAFEDIQHGTGYAGRRGLAIVSTNGSSQRLVPTRAIGARPFDWFPDGRSLLIGARGVLYRVDVNTANTSRIRGSPHFDFHRYRNQYPGRPRLSPDGRLIVYGSPFQGMKANTTALYLAEAKPDAEEVLLWHDPKEQPSSNPGWSPDGKWIAFLTRNEKTKVSRLMLIQANGGTAKELIRHGGDLWSPTWSRDCRSIVYAAGEEFSSKPWLIGEQSRARLLAVRVDGGGSQELARHQGSLNSPAWSPDGRLVVYLRGTFAKGFQAWLVDVEKRTPVHLALDDYGPRDVQWHHEGGTLFFVGKQQGVAGSESQVWAIDGFLPSRGE